MSDPEILDPLEFCVWPLFCNVVLGVPFHVAIMLRNTMPNVFLLSQTVSVRCLFLVGPWMPMRASRGMGGGHRGSGPL